MLNMFTCLHLGLYLVHFGHRMWEIDHVRRIISV
jgi:hypothetical protein